MDQLARAAALLRQQIAYVEMELVVLELVAGFIIRASHKRH